MRGRGRGGRGRGEDKQSHGRGRGRGASNKDLGLQSQPKSGNQKQPKRQQIWAKDEESKEGEDGAVEEKTGSGGTEEATSSKKQGKGPNDKVDKKQDPKKDPNYNEDASGKTLKFVKLENYKTFAEAASAITQAFPEYKNTSPSALRSYLDGFVKSSLKRGLALREKLLSMDDGAKQNEKDGSVLTQGIFKYEEFGEELAATPSAQDYVIYFIVNLIGALSREKKSLINKSPAFFDIYYNLVGLIFKVESTNQIG